MVKKPLKVVTIRQKTAQNPSLFDWLPNECHTSAFRWQRRRAQNTYTHTHTHAHTHTHTHTHNAEEDQVEHLHLKDT